MIKSSIRISLNNSTLAKQYQRVKFYCESHFFSIELTTAAHCGYHVFRIKIPPRLSKKRTRAGSLFFGHKLCVYWSIFDVTQTYQPTCAPLR